jgi:hypothetical protein
MSDTTPPPWLGQPDLAPILCGAIALAFHRSMRGFVLTPDDRIRVLTRMLALECGMGPKLEDAFAAAAYAAQLLGHATHAAWQGRVAALLATPAGRA